MCQESENHQKNVSREWKSSEPISCCAPAATGYEAKAAPKQWRKCGHPQPSWQIRCAILRFAEPSCRLPTPLTCLWSVSALELCFLGSAYKHVTESPKTPVSDVSLTWQKLVSLHILTLQNSPASASVEVTSIVSEMWKFGRKKKKKNEREKLMVPRSKLRKPILKWHYLLCSTQNRLFCPQSLFRKCKIILECYND